MGPHVQAADVKDYRSEDDDEEHAYLVRKNVGKGDRHLDRAVESASGVPAAFERPTVGAPCLRGQGRFGFLDLDRSALSHQKNESHPLGRRKSVRPNDDGA